MSLKKIEGDYEKPSWTQGLKNETKRLGFFLGVGELPSIKPEPIKSLLDFDKLPRLNDGKIDPASMDPYFGSVKEDKTVRILPEFENLLFDPKDPKIFK